MRALLLVFTAVLALSSAFAAHAGVREKCKWGMNGKLYDTAEQACRARVDQINLDRPADDKWEYYDTVKGDMNAVPEGVTDRRDCRALLKVFGNDPQVIGATNKTCTSEEFQCTSGKLETRIFQWLEHRNDDYDLYKVPRLISFDGCEYKRQDDTVYVRVQKGQCSFPASVEFRSTGEERSSPEFEDVPEKCKAPGDDDDDDDDGGGDGDNSATPGSFPTIRGLYERKYPNGIKGVLQELKAQADDTGAIQFVNAVFAPINSVGGNCVQGWTVAFELPGIGNFGALEFVIDCQLMTLMHGMMVIGSLLLARAIIFGG